MAPVLAEIDANGNGDEQVLSSTKNNFRKTIVTESDDDDNESGLQLDMSSDEDADYSSDDENRRSITLEEAMGRKPPVKSTIDGPAPKSKKAAPPRRRRRSSARFLRLSGRFDSQDDDEEEEDSNNNDEQLGEMYKRAIRLNAENRINAGNSWGLNLIDNIDKFLTEDKNEEMPNAPYVQLNDTVEEDEQRVNFTKASCTLDASVKIYSYRVDDVHLTSYKVLANLNRTESGKKDKTENEVESQNDESPEDPASPSQTKHHSRKVADTTETLESNITNINMNKLDSAFDIDPLFHKMSKTFDEGGAKGLLLVNLGVGNNGCNIVFDSKQESLLDNTNPAEKDAVSDDCPLEQMNRLEGMIDISSLSSKLESLLSGSSIHSVPLVPQLASLRDDYVQLKAEGFVDDKSPRSRSRRYASSNEEEKEAEQSIHQEAIERSRMSLGASVATDKPPNYEDEDQFAADDFGGDDDNDDDDMAFADFIGADENGGRYSSISFQNEKSFGDIAPGTQDTQPSATLLLDAMMSGDVFAQGGDYEYFSQESLGRITGGNLWAGSAHWKKSEKIRQKKANGNPGQKKPRRKKATKQRKFLDLRDSLPCLEKTLTYPKKSKKGGDPIQLSKATKTKHTKNDNLLPPDAGIGLEELSKLFLRPNAFVRKTEETGDKGGKTVGFRGLEPFGSGDFDDGDDGSFGDDDGPGFDFADPGDGTYGGNDDVVVGELDGVRKVDKVKVGYATIAKKVDVRRLKKDLWSEIEMSVMPQEDNDTNVSIVSDEEAKQPERENKTESNSSDHISFKETVEDMNSSQAQTDVTLPFYFICLLHLANEKGLRLESHGLEDFLISHDDGTAPSFGTLPVETTTGASTTTIASQREKRVKESVEYQGMEDADEESVERDA